MSFSSVRFSSFRNLVDGEIDTRAKRIFLIGENGQGKSNFLESLYYLSYGTSFRGSSDQEVTRRGEDGFFVFGNVLRFDESSFPEQVTVQWRARTKEIRREGKMLRDRKELIDVCPTIIFCHDDFSFAAGEPERKRFFFDQTASLCLPEYLDQLRDYRRILKQRNAALREGRLELLSLYDEQLVATGLCLMAARRELSTRFRPCFAELYERISLLGSAIQLEYRPSWKNAEDTPTVLEALRDKRAEEIAMKTSLSGPHRDRWVFTVDQRDFAVTASTGQLRLLSLVLRTAQAAFFSEEQQRNPVLLLDDVLLELDPGKRRRFLETLPQKAQSFFTFLPGEPWEEYKGDDTKVYRVHDGRFTN